MSERLKRDVLMHLFDLEDTNVEQMWNVYPYNERIVGGTGVVLKFTIKNTEYLFYVDKACVEITRRDLKFIGNFDTKEEWTNSIVDNDNCINEYDFNCTVNNVKSIISKIYNEKTLTYSDRVNWEIEEYIHKYGYEKGARYMLNDDLRGGISKILSRNITQYIVNGSDRHKAIIKEYTRILNTEYIDIYTVVIIKEGIKEVERLNKTMIDTYEKQARKKQEDIDRAENIRYTARMREIIESEADEIAILEAEEDRRCGRKNDLLYDHSQEFLDKIRLKHGQFSYKRK